MGDLEEREEEMLPRKQSAKKGKNPQSINLQRKKVRKDLISTISSIRKFPLSANPEGIVSIFYSSLP